jgi:transcriptional regulator with GAF, ATPase, and Fis domain
MQSNKNPLEEKFRRIIETFDAVNSLNNPLTDSIENLLKVSAAYLNSEEASVIIRDGNDGDMKFLTATGKVADKLKGLKIPAGKGIAGFVFSSGQPMAIADAGQEKSFYAEIDKNTGYTTQTLLATPLRYNGEVIGVLEFVNRVGDPPFENFTPLEMDKAAMFAEAIGSLVNAYESAKAFSGLNEKLLRDEQRTEFAEILDWVDNLRSAAEHREMIKLAILVREIAGRGAEQRELCREILEAISRHTFTESGTEMSFLSF